ncbi:MAG: hypothetical protein OHK0019_16200 [Saprospiraceae bacterium]
MSFDTFAYGAVRPLVKFENVLGTMVSYEMAMSITFTGEQSSDYTEMMEKSMSEKYGEKNVRISPANSSKHLSAQQKEVCPQRTRVGFLEISGGQAR